MGIKGLNDTVTIKAKDHTSDGRGGVSTELTTIIESLTCSLQSVRREELRIDPQGQTVIDPYMLIFDNITTGSTVQEGHIVVHSSGNYLVIQVATLSGKGTHTEAILRKISGDTVVN